MRFSNAFSGLVWRFRSSLHFRIELFKEFVNQNHTKSWVSSVLSNPKFG
jgi:hypothetical protein